MTSPALLPLPALTTLAALPVHPMLVRLGMVFVWCLIGGALLALAVRVASGRSHNRHSHGHHHHRRHDVPFVYATGLIVCFLASCLAILVFFVPMFLMSVSGYVDQDAPTLIFTAAAWAVPATFFLATALFTADKARISFGRALWVSVVFFLFMSPLIAGFWILSNILNIAIIGFEG